MLVLLASSASAASPFVDPDGIGAEAPDMLIPEKIVSSCQPGKFWISLNDPIEDVPSTVDRSVGDGRRRLPP